ncbi:MAG: undecaprenyldiphospho-muramoylpentapeptide beta-N-acetylglucosaminyltransferase [Bacteroidales bacterium]
MKKKIIISGGGTGGHIFPAISIANAIKDKYPDTEILFVGAQGKMEMDRVPLAGYKIIGLPVAGLKRSLSLSNLKLPFMVVKSIYKARKIIKEFNPDCAVGVGGYASAPLVWSAAKLGVPCLIQEQNSYAGLTNKIVGKYAKKICVAYSGMDRFFPSDKILYTGNPIRKEILSLYENRITNNGNGNNKVYKELRAESYEYFKLDKKKKTVFVVGGSLGCGTFNRIMKTWIKEKAKSVNYQILWQSGKAYKNNIETFKESLDGNIPSNIKNLSFVNRMDLAFTAADIIVSRAGAGSISELCCIGKPCIFVPSPVVAEDHQTHNAESLANKNAALMIKDSEADVKLIRVIENLLDNNKLMESLSDNIITLAKPDAADIIAIEIMKLADIK